MNAEAEDATVDDAGKAPLIDHLIELRNRLTYSVGAVFVAFLIAYFFAEDIFAFLVRPLADVFEGSAGRRMIFTGLHETFFTYIKVSFFAAVFVSFPMIASQFWLFVAPGMYKHEKRALAPFLVATPILFFTGGALVYYLIFPLAWQFFIGFETTGAETNLPIQLEARVSEYLSLVMKLIFAFGLCFQMPVLLTLMARVGIVSADGLAKRRKYALVIVFIIAAILTPPDVISQIGLALPAILLYEVSILCARVVEKKRAEREAAEDDDA